MSDINVAASALVGPMLGKVPEIGPILSALWGMKAAVGSANFNEELMSRLTSIENTVNLMEKELEMISLDVKTLIFDLKHQNRIAAQEIENWWGSKQADGSYAMDGVYAWMKTGQTSLPMTGHFISTSCPVGSAIHDNCYNYLLNIHSAIMGNGQMSGTGPDDNVPSESWLGFVIEKFLSNEANSTGKSVSFLELTYRYFLKLVHLQLKGLSCLGAINNPNIQLYSANVHNNIVQQGITCQNIVNYYIKHHEVPFTWIGNKLNSNCVEFSVYHPYDVNFLETSTEMAKGGQILCGAELFQRSVPNQQHASMQVCSASIDHHGELNGQNWTKTPPTNSGQVFHKSSDQLCKAVTFNNSIGSIPGHVIIGIQPKINVDTDEFGMNFATLCGDVIFAPLNAVGTLDINNKISKTMSGAHPDNGAGYSMNIGGLQYSKIPNFNPTSPITGFGYVDDPSGTVSVRLQTSIHQNAFNPIAIKSNMKVALYSAALGAYLSNNNDPTETPLSMVKERVLDGSQDFELEITSNPGKYCATVKINNGGNGNMSYSEVDKVLCWQHNTEMVNPTPLELKIADPTDINGSESEVPLTNWNTVVLLSQTPQLAGLAIQPPSEIGGHLVLTQPKTTSLNNKEAVASNKCLWQIIPTG